MWSAIANGKLRLAEEHRSALDHELRTAEDVLTGMVFGRLAYLPPALAWSIVIESAAVLRGARPTRGPGALRQELWPRLPPPRGVDQQFVEPDVLWVTDGHAVIIEVKWGDAQKPAQLDREYAAVAEHRALLEVTVVALGNVAHAVRQHLAEAAKVPNLLALSWLELRRGVDAELGASGLAPEHRAVLTDLLGIMESRGLRRTEYLSGLLGMARSTLDAGTLLNMWSVT